jgi:RNA polymerase-binding transcription factor DksA
MAATKKTPTTEPAKKVASPAKKAAAKAAPAAKAPAPAAEPADHPDSIPAPRGTTKEGIVYTKDFDVKFLKAQHDALVAERAALTGQATRLEDEANSLIEDGEMGDVQFDDESGEGDTMVVERERDLALSAQARQTVAEIDAALERMALGTYGYSVVSGAPIPRERLEAIPWATVLVEEKVGGIGRR